MNICYLYTPVLKADSLIANRHSITANVVVLDLEDSTHINAKADARAKLGELDMSPLTELGIKIGLRINAIFTYDGLRDLELVRSLCQKGRWELSYVFLPKVNHASEVELYKRLFSSLPVPPKAYTFIETVEAVDNADEIASVSDALCFGQADLVSEMYSPNETFINYARARMCIAAARYSIEAIDTNSFDIENMASFEAECVAARGYGFTGKAAIHPRQVPVINEIFAVSLETVARYQTTVDTYHQSDVGFVLLDGEVIAPPFVAKARRMLALYTK